MTLLLDGRLLTSVWLVTLVKIMREEGRHIIGPEAVNSQSAGTEIVLLFSKLCMEMSYHTGQRLKRSRNGSLLRNPSKFCIAQFFLSCAKQTKPLRISTSASLFCAARWPSLVKPLASVWSFGVTLHEIWNKAEIPYEGWHNQKVDWRLKR